MRFTLKEDWKLIARKAWSFRLNALSAILMSAEVVLPLYVDSIPRHMFAILSLIAVGGSMWARLVYQRGVK